MAAAVVIELSVAADVAGGESVRNMFVLRCQRVRSSCGRCTRRGRPRCPWGGGCSCTCCSYCCCRCPWRFWRDERAFQRSGPEGGDRGH